MYIQEYIQITEGYNVGFYTEHKQITMLDFNYAEITSYIEFDLKAEYVPSNVYSSFGFNSKYFSNLWYNKNNNKLYSIKTL